MQQQIAYISLGLQDRFKFLSLLLTIGCSFAWTVPSNAQFHVTPGFTASQLAGAFSGNGVVVSNATYGGGTQNTQIGVFTNANSNLPFASGLFMCSGLVEDHDSVLINTQGGFGSVGPGTPGDADLDAIAFPTMTNDAAVLEFDFIPQGDSLFFNYVFASEEYNEYTCSEFNDVFAFIISGPGFASPQNIALIPNTTEPVTINTVNNGSVGSFGMLNNCTAPNGSLANSNYFVDNTGGSYIEFDGMTTALTAIAQVIPDSTYHIKLAVADVFDAAFDSGVYLEAGSFSSAGINQTAFGAVAAVTSDVSCNGGNNGEVTAIGVAGSGNYSYLWSTGDTTATVTGLPAGTYTVTVSDSIDTETITVTVNEPVLLILTDSITNESVNGANDGAIDITVSGGTTPYTYTWSNGAATEDLSNLVGASAYTVTITDANNCTISQTYTLSISSSLAVVVLSISDVSCFLGNDGEATVTGVGGSGQYTYAWSTGDTTATASGLVANVYDVTVSDGIDAVTISIDIAQATELTLSGNTTDESASGANNGAVDITFLGGTAPYTYIWSNGATTEDITGLSEGTSYTVTGTDANGCTLSQSFTVGVGTALTAIANVDTDVSCFGGNDGTATAVGLGGSGNYSYAWSTGQTTATITNLTAGIYTVTVNDGNGTSSASVTISEPPALTISNSIVIDESTNGANDGGIGITVNGGTAPYSYAWSTGDTSAAIMGLAGANSYDVTVTDANNCTLTQSYALLVISVENIENYNTSLEVFPNPAQDILTIRATTPEATVRIYNVMGALVLEDNVILEQGQVSIDVSRLIPGQYILELQNAYMVLYQQWVKE